MKILLFGKTGQVGWELQRSLAPLGELISLETRSTDYCGNLLDPQGIAKTVRSIRPDVIVNAAAYTAVDKAESDQDNAHTINALAPAAMAQAACEIGASLVHYSTDYVFNGSGLTPWTETDTPAPLSVYGASKLAGEQAIAASGARHLIFRTSWVYASRGNNFAKTMLRLAQERESLSVINDQIGAPTGADLLADITAHALCQLNHTPQLSGLYHLTADGETSWHGYALHVFAQAKALGKTLKLDPAQCQAIPTSAYPTAAQRPLNSRLSCTKLKSAFNLYIPHWQSGVDRMLSESL
jgi:dTDP-4-dehydrorhamnose reductase